MSSNLLRNFCARGSAPAAAAWTVAALLSTSGRGECSDAEVTVHGAGLRHAEREPTVASSVVYGAELSVPGNTSADLLARLPGVQITRSGGAAELATASIRGAGAEQVPVYLAGIRVNDDVSGTADLSTLPLWMMDRVEVFRGNAPEDADRLGPGGAIFFWPRLPRERRVGVGAEIGSFGARAGSVAVEHGARGHGTLLALRASRADNDYVFLDDRGQRFDLDEVERRRQNADHPQLDAWFLHRQKLGNGVGITAVLNALDREQGITGLSVIPARRARAHSRRWLAGSSVFLPCGSRDACRLELTNAFLSAGSVLSDPLLELSAVQARELRSEGERGSLGARIEIQATPDLRFTGGASAALEHLRVDREGTIPRRGQRRSLVARAGATLSLSPALDVNALAGIECHGTQGVIVRLNRRAFRESDLCGLAQPVGRLGLRYELGAGLELLANGGRYLRLPTLGELYGTAPLVDGNPALLPERGHSADLGARWGVLFGPAALRAEAFAFARTIDQVIAYRRSGAETLAPFNVAAARVLGAEWAAQLEVFGHARLDLAGTLLDPRETTADVRLDPTSNDILPYIARFSGAVRLELYREHPLPHVRRAAAGIAYFHESSRFADSAGQGVLPPQRLVDADVALELLDGQLIARLSFKNLFDARTSDVVGLPLPGRAVYAGAEAWF